MKHVIVDASFASQILCMPLHELEYYSTTHCQIQMTIAMSKVAHVWFEDALDHHLRVHLYLDLEDGTRRMFQSKPSAPRNNAKALWASSALVEVLVVEMWMLRRLRLMTAVVDCIIAQDELCRK